MNTQTSALAALHGLVLAGGRSKRMQRDKAALAYAGRTQLERAMELLQPHVAHAFVSVREDQVGDPVRARFPQIVDTGVGVGPIAGIIAAQTRHPHVAWLVLACDLPFLDSETLEHLVRSRQPDRQATAYRSSYDGLPEPLCAIYEPSSVSAIATYVASGHECPRKFLSQADVALLQPLDPHALDNVNTPKEYGSANYTLRRQAQQRARSAHGAGSASAGGSMRVTVQYYALLREQAGRSTETLTTEARTPRELYAELAQRHPFSLAPEMLRVAVNDEFGDWSQPLTEGDAVVFIPPVAGG
jgi:molybdenum cofactor guanylyltransferase